MAVISRSKKFVVDLLKPVLLLLLVLVLFMAVQSAESRRLLQTGTQSPPLRPTLSPGPPPVYRARSSVSAPGRKG
ncbi:unnamed protein product [Linum trigynum]|uniref:Uncharacterized protein n=1 Tax=Linum trigynum TaxID=586398 RepID=A0AAV2GFF0_9ROSI